MTDSHCINVALAGQKHRDLPSFVSAGLLRAEVKTVVRNHAGQCECFRDKAERWRWQVWETRWLHPTHVLNGKCSMALSHREEVLLITVVYFLVLSVLLNYDNSGLL